YPTIWIRLILKTGGGNLPQKAGQKTFDFGFFFVLSFFTYPTIWIRLILKTGGGNLPLEFFI
ncbi:MAG: hypothetical protein ACI4JM_05915, partial [Oscillospiraceae bacterium]